jgi:TRAP-type C4-dicarboxylate transport system substrate-binding protein
MKKFYMVILSLIIISILILCGCTKTSPAPATTPEPSQPAPSTSPAETEEPIVLKYASPYPDVLGFSKADMSMMNKIEQKTNGRVKFETYFGGTLIGAPECLTELAAGVCDLGTGIVQFAPSGLDVLKLMEGAYYGCSELETELRVCDEVNAKYPELEGGYANYGKLLTRTWNPPYQLDTLVRIDKVEDLKGKTIRTTAILAKVFKELGGEGVVIPMGEAYTSLEKGIIDGVTGAHEQLIGGRFGEVTKYHCELNIRCGGQAAAKLINWDTYNNLPPDIQKVFDDSWDEWRQEIITEMLKGEDAGVEFAEQQGGVFYELSPEELNKFYALMDKVYLVEMAALDAKGLPATKIYKEVRSLTEKYSK